jgi:two-component system, cell cycle response regulator DivK
MGMAKANILVIEDNVDNLELVRFLLEQSDYEVHGAADGLEGLRYAQELQPDMILLDMSLPEIDGWTLARQLKADPKTAEIIVVALTAHALPGDRKKALDAGCNGYISKPLDVPNFVSVVATYLRKRRPLSQTGNLML